MLQLPGEVLGNGGLVVLNLRLQPSKLRATQNPTKQSKVRQKSKEITQANMRKHTLSRMPWTLAAGAPSTNLLLPSCFSQVAMDLSAAAIFFSMRLISALGSIRPCRSVC